MNMNMMMNVTYLTIHHTENIVLKQVKEKKFMPKDNAKDAEDFSMERDRAYLRKQRRRKIKQRKRLIEDLNHNWYISPELRSASKRDEVISGEKDGYLATGGNGFIGSMGTHKKTNTRKGHASYRHSGDYGKADEYTPHDQKQIDAMEHDMKELETENLTD